MMNPKATTILSSLLALAINAPLLSQQIVPNQPSAKVSNRKAISDAFAAGRTVDLPSGTIYIDGTITTPTKVGCGRLRASGAMSGNPVNNHPTMTGNLTRLVQVGKGPLLRLSGSGFTTNDPIEWVGDGESAIIEVEGRESPPTGEFRFRDQTFCNGTVAIHCIGGYYDQDGKLVSNDAHADVSIVEGCSFYGVGACFRSDNLLCMSWTFNDCRVCAYYQTKFPDCVVADMRRGGALAMRGLQILHPKATIFRVRDYSPNNCNLSCTGFFRDRGMQADDYLTLFEYTGPEGQPDWILDISGVVNVSETPFDREKLLKVPTYLPRRDWNIDIKFAGTTAPPH